jgi:hypothetical protein
MRKARTCTSRSGGCSKIPSAFPILLSCFDCRARADFEVFVPVELLVTPLLDDGNVLLCGDHPVLRQFRKFRDFCRE